MSDYKVAILGAGPAGVGAAWKLARTGRGDVVVLERSGAVGGNAGSFELAGVHVDYGSHRLHSACDASIMRDIRGLLGAELLDRPRHGRIRLRGRWIHFPLRPVDLVVNLPPSFALGVAGDAARKLLGRSTQNGDATFESILESGLGRTICRDFYFPYAVKLWGLQPSELSPIQAQRRVAAGSLAKMVRKVLSAVPGLKPAGSGRFFYPSQGFGQITQAYADSAIESGAEIRFNSAVTRVRLGDRHTVEFECGPKTESISAEHVWSTIPISILAKLVDPPPPPDVLAAADSIRYRSMILVYLVVGQTQFSPYDAHYFPESDIPISRMSEPRNYSGRDDPIGQTVLCGELPCRLGDQYWNASDEELGDIMVAAVERCGLQFGSRIEQVVTRRLPFAYPIYDAGFERHFEAMDRWLIGLNRVLTFGRQGLFAHDNTHHALAMAYAAVECLNQGGFDAQRWSEYRTEFAKHVVED